MQTTEIKTKSQTPVWVMLVIVKAWLLPFLALFQKEKGSWHSLPKSQSNGSKHQSEFLGGWSFDQKTYPSRKLTYPTKREVRKIIDSKVPVGMGYEFVPERVPNHFDTPQICHGFLFWSHKFRSLDQDVSSHAQCFDHPGKWNACPESSRIQFSMAKQDCHHFELIILCWLGWW